MIDVIASVATHTIVTIALIVVGAVTIVRGAIACYNYCAFGYARPTCSCGHAKIKHGPVEGCGRCDCERNWR